MHERHKSSVSKEGQRSRCHVPLPCVCLLCLLAVRVCVRASRGCRDSAFQMTIECVSQDDSLLGSPGWPRTKAPRQFLTLQDFQKEQFMNVQLSLNSHESRGHVTRSLIVMLKPLQKERWKIPNLVGHALRPSDISVCSYQTEIGNSLCLYTFIAFVCQARRRKTFACMLLGDL